MLSSWQNLCRPWTISGLFQWHAATLFCIHDGHELNSPWLLLSLSASVDCRTQGVVSISRGRSQPLTTGIWHNLLCGAHSFAIVPINACARQPDSMVCIRLIGHHHTIYFSLKSCSLSCGWSARDREGIQKQRNWTRWTKSWSGLGCQNPWRWSMYLGRRNPDWYSQRISPYAWTQEVVTVLYLAPVGCVCILYVVSAKWRHKMLSHQPLNAHLRMILCERVLGRTGVVY